MTMIESGNPIGPVPQDELDYLVSRLRDDSPAHQPSDKRSAADAIVALRDHIAALTNEFKRVVQERNAARAECEKLRALLLKAYCYVAAHVPIGVKTDKDRGVLMLDIDRAIDAALKETK